MVLFLILHTYINLSYIIISFTFFTSLLYYNFLYIQEQISSTLGIEIVRKYLVFSNFYKYIPHYFFRKKKKFLKFFLLNICHFLLISSLLSINHWIILLSKKPLWYNSNPFIVVSPLWACSQKDYETLKLPRKYED